MSDQIQLRAFVYLDRLQPQFAAFAGAVADGAPPVEDMSSLYVELSPSNWVFPIVDKVLKSVDVLPGAQLVERQYGMLEVHSESQAEVRRAAEVILEEIGVSETDRIAPRVVSEQVVTNIHPRQAQVLNRKNWGTIIEGGQSMLILEVEPAAYICLAANEAEKASPVFLNQMNSTGVYGRMWMSGTEAAVLAARDAALAAIDAVAGQENMRE
ncbi:MAG: hypothetical protein R2722_08275 [Tessaracoccus sp.]